MSDIDTETTSCGRASTMPKSESASTMFASGIPSLVVNVTDNLTGLPSFAALNPAQNVTRTLSPT
jgi:hypothetical protein